MCPAGQAVTQGARTQQQPKNKVRPGAGRYRSLHQQQRSICSHSARCGSPPLRDPRALARHAVLPPAPRCAAGGEQSRPRAHLVRIQRTFCTSDGRVRALAPTARKTWPEDGLPSPSSPRCTPPNSAPVFCAGAEQRKLRTVSPPVAESWWWWEMASAEPEAPLTCGLHVLWLPEGAEESQAAAASDW